MKKINNSKSGQFFIISCFFLMLALLFIYSIDTNNSYIVEFNQITIIDDIVYESCQIGYLSNGSSIENNFNKFENLINQDCTNSNYNCQLSITKSGSAPTNLSLLNYTHFNYNLNFDSEKINYSNGFTC